MDGQDVQDGRVEISVGLRFSPIVSYFGSRGRLGTEGARGGAGEDSPVLLALDILLSFSPSPPYQVRGRL